MEKVPELLAITGFLKSFLMSWGYEITFKIINTSTIIPKIPNKYFKLGLISCRRLPKENSASINPDIGMGIFLIIFI